MIISYPNALNMQTNIFILYYFISYPIEKNKIMKLAEYFVYKAVTDKINKLKAVRKTAGLVPNY